MMQEWFERAKLGIFIHWGIYSVDGVPESWSLFNGLVSDEEYYGECERFTASQFDADAWAETFKRAGADYVVLTAKHHDGIALFDTKQNDFSVVKQTLAGRDLIAPYCEAVRNHGMHAGLYFSHCDWHDARYPVVFNAAYPGQYHRYNSPEDGVERPEIWKQFLEFRSGQLKELLTNYGEIDLLWFDGDWERTAEQWHMKELRDELHRCNPRVVLNSRMCGYGDYETPEQGQPIVPPKGIWEFCMTINDSWGYQPQDKNFKTPGQVIRTFSEIVSMGGKLLLDIGPKEDGTILPEQLLVLRELGKWISSNDEAVHNTSQGIGPEYFTGGTTVSGDKKTIYLHYYDIPKEKICVKGIKNNIKNVTLLRSGKTLEHTVIGGAQWHGIPGVLWIDLDQSDTEKYVTVIKIELDGELDLYRGSGASIQKN